MGDDDSIMSQELFEFVDSPEKSWWWAVLSDIAVSVR
jgi:hypothetical protein